MPQSSQPVREAMATIHSGEDILKRFHLLFCSYYGQVYRFFLRKGVSGEDAPDLTQEVFLAVYKRLGTLQHEEQVQAWLFTIARNVFLNELGRRHAKKREAAQVIPTEAGEECEPAGMDVFPAKDASVFERLLNDEKLARLAEAMQSLPVKMRRCLELRIREESSYEEIALVMDISINTVKAHLHQAREILKEKLSAYFDVEVS